MYTAPATPAALSPTANETEPACPPLAFALPMMMSPELPFAVVPVDKRMAPVAPELRTFAEYTVMAPIKANNNYNSNAHASRSAQLAKKPRLRLMEYSTND